MGGRRGVTRAPFTDDEKRQIVEQYGDKTIGQLAKEFRCDHRKIRDVIESGGKRIIPRHEWELKETNWVESSINRGMTTTWRAAARQHYLDAGMPSVAALYPDPAPVEVYDD